MNRLGPRVDFKEMEGLFSKSASRRGIFRSDPLDRDLRARVRLDLDLILRVHLGSHRWSPTRARGGGARPPAALLRGGGAEARRSSPQMALQDSIRPDFRSRERA